MYVKYVINMAVALFSSRWVLLALGEEDFGIYNLVAGLLSMLMFLNVTMASSTQRFLSYAVGTKDEKLMRETFYNSCIIHLFIGIIILCLFESVGVYFLHHILSVPVGKMHLAEFVLHSLSISTFITIICVPYYAALITHENIVYVSIIQIVEALMKFGVAYWLLYLVQDQLRFYSIAMMSISIIGSFAYLVYVVNKYKETRFTLRWLRDSKQMKSLLSYSSWNLVGGISSMFRNQGIAMLLNSFFGVIINAAWGIAQQINGQLSFFSHAIVTATRPQIVKSEGSGNRKRMLSLSMTTCKITVLILAFLSVPLIVEMPYILELWLKKVPDNTVIFSRFILLLTMISQMSIGISISVESVGNIKLMQLMVGGLHFVVLPVGYILLKLGCLPYTVCVVMLAEESLAFCFRLYVSQKIAGLPVLFFIRKIVLPATMCILFAYFICMLLTQFVGEGFLRLIMVSACSFIIIAFISYKYILFDNERNKILSFCRSIATKI
jgi:Na+-driven multidrug efflux pump